MGGCSDLGDFLFSPELFLGKVGFVSIPFACAWNVKRRETHKISNSQNLYWKFLVMLQAYTPISIRVM